VYGMVKIFPPDPRRTLDKELDKLTRLEEAANFVSRRFFGVGLGLILLVLMIIFTGIYVLDRPGAAIIIGAAAIGAYMAINIGANDVTNNVGAAVGASAMTMGSALMLAAVCEFAGATISGGTVVTTISSGIIDQNGLASPDAFIWAMMAALLSAALWVNLATALNAPVSTTHTVVGGVLGAGIAAAGPGIANWHVMSGIVLSWLISPLLGGVIAAGLLWFIKETILYKQDKIAAARRWVPVLIAVMAGSFTTYLALQAFSVFYAVTSWQAILLGLAAGVFVWLVCIPVIARQSEGLENRKQSLRPLFRIPLIFSAALLCYAHGSNDVANAIGPMTAIVQMVSRSNATAMETTLTWQTLIGALGISAGVLLFGPKLIILVGKRITKLNAVRAYCVSLSAALTVIVASAFGLPVSSTHIAVGAVFGVGFFREWYMRHSKTRAFYLHRQAIEWKMEDHETMDDQEFVRRALVRRSHLMHILAAWIVTVPVSAALAALLYFGMVALFM
jgi:inorganic phosphate transporter, PiT family